VFHSLLVIAAVCGASPAKVTEPDTQEHHDANIKPLVAGIEAAKGIVIYEGVPRTRPKNEAVEEGPKAEQGIIRLKGFSFYKEVVVHNLEIDKSLTELCSDAKTFGIYRGPKFCGGFHPDWCIDFKNGKDIYRVLICGGCHEARLYGPKKTQLYSDLDEDAFKALIAVLGPLKKKQPQADAPK